MVCDDPGVNEMGLDAVPSFAGGRLAESKRELEPDEAFVLATPT
jgi:hypothetical protein